MFDDPNVTVRCRHTSGERMDRVACDRPVGYPTGRDRQREILALLTEGDPDVALVERVCAVSAALLGVSGAGMCLIGGAQHQVIVHGTDPLIEALEDLQVTLGQGPCLEAVRTGYPVLVPDLQTPAVSPWPEYLDQATARGVRAVFAFPVHADGVLFGALDLYRMTAGPLDDAQLADAVDLAELAARSMAAQGTRDYFDGSVSALDWLTAGQQATGTGPGRAVDLGITVGQALAPTPRGGVHDALRPDGQGENR